MYSPVLVCVCDAWNHWHLCCFESTGAIMENLAKDLLGLQMCKFLPKHNRNLSNEFRCFVNYPSGLLSGWWVRAARDQVGGQETWGRGAGSRGLLAEDGGGAAKTETLKKNKSGGEKCKQWQRKTWKVGSYFMYFILLWLWGLFSVLVLQVYLCEITINNILERSHAVMH